MTACGAVSSRPRILAATSVFLATAALSCCCPVRVTAGTGGPITAPHPTLKAQHGIDLSVDAYWVEGRGYRPVKIEASASKAVDYDRSIAIELGTCSQYWRESAPDDMRVSHEFQLPAGKSSASATVAIPQFNEWGRLGWTVYVDGQLAKELSTSHVAGPSQQGGWDDAAVRALLIKANPPAPPASTVPAPLAARMKNRRWMATGAPAAIDANYGPTVAELAPDSLPQRWLDYSSLDLIYVSLPQLRVVVNEYPDAWLAIRRWTATGGNLVVHDIGARWRDISALEEALRLATQPEGEPNRRGWRRKIEPAFRGRRQAGDFRVQSFSRGPQFVAPEPMVPDDVAKPATQPRGQQLPGSVVWREYQFGSVVAVTTSLDADRGFFRPQQALEVLNSQRQSWPQRHGLLPEMGSRDYWDLLIPDVGLAPVTAFRILITLFVIVIGPVNYFLLRRWRKLQLLLLTVPLSAAVVTMALLLYALVSDGLGTRVRVRSFTAIDQRSGEAVCWSRQSYYAGLAPGDGLRMPDDTVMLPIRPRSRYGHYSSPYRFLSLKLDWSEDQHLARGWLNSRTPTQYLAIRARQTASRLHVQPGADGIQVHNRLGARIDQLLVCNRDGELYWGESIDSRAAAKLTEIANDNAQSRMAAIFREHAPRPPTDLMAGDAPFGLNARTTYRYWDPDEEYRSAAIHSSRLEWALDRYGPGSSFKLQPRTYLAVVSRSPEVTLGVEGVEEVASFHVVHGRW